MSKTLLITAHPNLAQSRHNAALIKAAEALPNVTVHDLYQTYPDFVIDVEAERALLEAHDVIVFQHPLYWYSATPLLRQWQDAVLTYGWAYTADGSPSRTHGKKAVVSITTGGTADAYTPEGRNQATIDTLLSSWSATLRLCQFDIQPTFVLHGAGMGPVITDDDLLAIGRDYTDMITTLAAA